MRWFLQSHCFSFSSSCFHCIFTFFLHSVLTCHNILLLSSPSQVCNPPADHTFTPPDHNPSLLHLFRSHSRPHASHVGAHDPIITWCLLPLFSICEITTSGFTRLLWVGGLPETTSPRRVACLIPLAITLALPSDESFTLRFTTSSEAFVAVAASRSYEMYSCHTYSITG